MSADNHAIRAREDVAVFKAVVEAGINVTSHVFHGLWSHFHDVELIVPLAVMEMPDSERAPLVIDILNEMDGVLTKIERAFDAGLGEDATTMLPLEHSANLLWKELAGCYASNVNSGVPVVDPELRETMQANMLNNLAQQFDLDLDTIRFRLKTDSHLRMSIRMTGLDPDLIN